MKRVLIWLVLCQHFEKSYAWQSAKQIVEHAKANSISLSCLRIMEWI